MKIRKRRTRIARRAARPRRTSTWWNGEPCEARRVVVVVGKSTRPTFWYASLEGTRRRAVEVHYKEQHFFLDDAGGEGSWKVTIARGGPEAAHRSLPDDSEVVEVLPW